MTHLRPVVKALIRRPLYTAAIVLVTAVGFALLATVLAVVDGVLFKPLGYPGARQLVSIKPLSIRARIQPSVTADDVNAWAAASPHAMLTGFGVWGTRSGNSWRGLAEVQANFFDVIGVRPAIGGFTAEDFQSTTRSRIEPRIVTDDVFRTDLAGDLSIIGRAVVTDPTIGAGYRIVGVMPRGFVFPSDHAVGYLAASDGSWPIGTVIARLQSGTTAEELHARVLAAATARNAGRNQERSSAQTPIDGMEIRPLGRTLGAASRPLFTALLAAAVLVVVIGALNVSSLMAARAVDRRRELSVHRALGATSRDIGRILLLEAGLLVGAGAALGLLAATPLLRLAERLIPSGVALFRTVAIDWRIAASCAVLVLLLAILVALWPLRLASRVADVPGSTRSVTGDAKSISRRLVVMVQVAFALVLTVGGALLVGSLLSVYAQRPPINTSNVLAIRTSFLGTESRRREPSAERTTRANALIERVRSVAGVDAVALTAYELLDRAYVPSWFASPPTALKPKQAMMTQAVTADYYRLLQPQLVLGRLPTAAELATDQPVIVITENVVSNYWPNSSPIGQTLTDRGAGGGLRTFTVVGVVRNVRWYSWDEETDPMIYGPHALLARQSASTLLVRTEGAPERLTAEILRGMRETDPLLDLGPVESLDHLYLDSVRPRRFRAWLFGSFAFASLCVVAIGILGQLAMSTARRTREVGIRLACGATPGGIARLILFEQLWPVFAGLFVGGVGAAWAVQFVRSYLYQLTGTDPRVWAAAVGLILLTAIVGTLVPALRAGRTDPTQALRAD